MICTVSLSRTFSKSFCVCVCISSHFMHISFGCGSGTRNLCIFSVVKSNKHWKFKRIFAFVFHRYNTHLDVVFHGIQNHDFLFFPRRCVSFTTSWSKQLSSIVAKKKKTQRNVANETYFHREWSCCYFCAIISTI